MEYCHHCHKPLTKSQIRRKNKYCSSLCDNQHRQQQSLKQWLKTGKLDYHCNTMIKANSIYRHYIEGQQLGRCAICGINHIWNNQELIFVLDHIDGDSSNHNRENLRLICPNCDSQLDTYKSKNKKSSRNYRTYKTN